VVDESGSIGANNFNIMKLFLRQLVGMLNINSGNTKVGLVTFGHKVGTVFNLREHSSVFSLQSAISLLSYSSGRSTNTAAALAYVRTTMLTSAAGDRINAPNTVIVLTDGKSSYFHATAVSRL